MAELCNSCRPAGRPEDDDGDRQEEPPAHAVIASHCGPFAFDLLVGLSIESGRLAGATRRHSPLLIIIKLMLSTGRQRFPRLLAQICAPHKECTRSKVARRRECGGGQLEPADLRPGWAP